MNVHGGGRNTTINGLKFEKDTDLYTSFKKAGFSINKECFQSKSKFSKYLKTLGVDTSQHWSKKLLPDEAIFYNNTIYIIEKKYQQREGSVDEKIQTCDFKKRQYEKVANQIGMKVKFIYLMNDWFRQDKYKDVLEYITDVGCYYFFDEIPVSFFK